MTEAQPFDIAVIGGGIAGASAAAEMSKRHRVVLLEREAQPGYHSSGRSAALFCETIGDRVVRGLTLASRDALETPSPQFSTRPLLTPRGALAIGGPEDLDRLTAFFETSHALVPSVRRIDADEACRRVPVLRRAAIVGAVLEPDARDIDTHGMLQAHLRGLRARGGVIRLDAEVHALERQQAMWRIATRSGTVQARILVNAAGAWADTIAAMAGAAPIGLVPMRRTALLFEPPPGIETASWPLVDGIDESFYFKPDAGRIFASPADETPSAPCDARPEELDIAIAIENLQVFADLPVRRIVHSWAGLRSFVADRNPVVGFDPVLPDFFWLAAQGGYGFQTAPAMAASAAALITGDKLPARLNDLGVTAEDLSPARPGLRRTP